MNTDFLEVGERGALVCGEGPFVDALRETVEKIGFTCHIVNGPEQAIERMSFTRYDAVFLQQDPGNTPGASLVHNYVASLPMPQRRDSYTVLIGASLRTLDAMQAYAASVHLVVNPTDISNIGPILRKGLADFDRTYKTLREVQEDAGEEVSGD